MRTGPATLLTAAEVAETFRVSKATITRWHKAGTLRGVKVGGVLRFRRADVERLLTPGEAA